MSAYEEDANRLAEHISEECDEPYCQICQEELSDWKPTEPDPEVVKAFRSKGSVLIDGGKDIPPVFEEKE